MATSSQYDLLIAGGGLVGSSLAVALASSPLRIGIIEANSPVTEEKPTFDSRAIALAFGSRRIFEGMGCWSAIAPEATPIRRIHVSDRGHFGTTRMEASQISMPALGYVVEMRILGQLLRQRLQSLPYTELICPAKVVSIVTEETRIQVQIATRGEIHALSARLLIAADGSHSSVRQLLQIPAQQIGYAQTAIIANLTAERPPKYTAFERFTDTGPLALLPLGKERLNLIWTVKNSQAPYLTAVEDKVFLSHLQQRFGQRLGRFERIGKRYAYPLQLIRAQQQTVPRAILIGNAAHTLHPVAGQGFNLGLRDVAALAQILTESYRTGDDLGAPDTLSAYIRWRHPDQRLVTEFTDTVVRLFSNDYPLLGLLRGLGLATLDLLPPLKQRVMRHAMGLAGRQPRLSRGLPL